MGGDDWAALSLDVAEAGGWAGLSIFLFIFMGELGLVKFCTLLVLRQWLGLEGPASEKAAGRSWHVAFSVWSVSNSMFALSDLGLLGSFDLGLLDDAHPCAFGGASQLAPLPRSVTRLFAVQISHYSLALIAHPWIMRGEDDFWVMFAHHLFSILLCAAALLGRWPVWGVATILTHDVADLPLDSVLIAKELHVPWLTSALYVITLVTWAGARCCYFPWYVVRSVLLASARCDDVGCMFACAGVTAILGLDGFWLVKLIRIGLPQVRELLATRRGDEASPASAKKQE